MGTKIYGISVYTRIPKCKGVPPHADIMIELPEAIIGIVSERFRQFCGIPEKPLNEMYWDVSVGNNMKGYCRIRDEGKNLKFKFLQAYKLFRFALGIQSVTNGREIRKGWTFLM